MASLQCLYIKVALRTKTATSMLHGALTDLREAVAFLRKLADEIETELRSEPSRTRTPSREPEPAPTRMRPCL
jgi:delta 1-pyrroline-5-carboxylate dehydrogenase